MISDEYRDMSVSDEELAALNEDGPVSRKAVLDYGPPSPRPTRQPRGQYDWKTLTDGKWHTCERGKDFDVEVSGFQIRCHNYASRKGLYVLTQRINETTVEVRFFKTREEREVARIEEEDGTAT